MRLCYKPQSTQYTCHYATQAIILNSFLGTDVSDIDVVHASDGGFSLGRSIFYTAAINLGGGSRMSGFLAFSRGVHHALSEKGRLPDFDEWVHACVQYERKIAASYQEQLRREGKTTVKCDGGRETVRSLDTDIEQEIQRLRERTEESIQRQLAFAAQPDTRGNFDAYVSFVQKDVLSPIGNDFTIRDTQDWTGVRNLSQGRIAHRPLEGDDKAALLTREYGDAILEFGADRQAFGWDAPHSHSWLVDRLEGGSVVLLDTNAHVYGHAPEVVVQPEKLASASKIILFSLSDSE